MVRNEDTKHRLGSTKIQCPISWKPWDKYDFRAVRRGEWWIKFHPQPMYAYVAAHPLYGFQIIEAFRPFMTAPKSPKVWDLVAARIVQPS